MPLKLLPYEKFTILSKDPPPIVKQRLEAQIEEPKLFRGYFNRNHVPYEGSISETSFRIRRIIHYRNSFLPVIRGRFEPAYHGTQVHITMSLHPFIAYFLVVWCFAFFGSMFTVFFVHFANTLPQGLWGLFIVIPIFVLMTFWWAFWREANKSRHELTELISGNPEQTSL